LLYHRLPPPTFGGAVCPSYEEYRWRLLGDRLTMRLISGGCHDYASGDISRTEWTRVG
jgi:hypothetical protein